MTRKVHLEFAIGESLACLYNGTAYNAKVIDIKDEDSADPKYVIHFKGWNVRYDELIPVSKMENRLHKGTAADYIAKHGAPNPDDTQLKKGKKQRDDSPESSTPSAKNPRSKKSASSTFPDDMEVSVELPLALRKLLTDDYDLVARHFHTRVPAVYSIDRIVADYVKSIPLTSEQLKNVDDLFIEYDSTNAKVTNVALICTARGLCDYFNVILGYQLLYKFERNQYNDLVQSETATKGIRRGSIATLPEHGFRASAYYGIIHLLRMISRLPILLKLTKWNDHLINRVMVGVHDFLVFLNKNHKTYFTGAEDYQAATSEYYRRAQTIEEEAGTSQ